MPLFPSEDLKRRFIEAEGLDPSKYDIDEASMSFIPRASLPSQSLPGTPPTAPETTANLAGTPPTSKLESFGRSAAESALPTAASLGTMLLGSAMFPEPASPLLATLGLLLAGAGAGIGTSALQKKVVPQSVQESLFVTPESAQNKYSTIAGGFAPSALAFNPAKGLMDLPMLGRGLSKIPAVMGPVGRTALTAAEEQALLNAAMNVVPAAGMNAYEQVQGGQPFDVGAFLANSLPGALFTRPTGLGKRLGFQDPITEQNLAQLFPQQPTLDVQAQPATERPLTAEEIAGPYLDKTAAHTTPEGRPGREGEPRSYKGFKGVERMEKESYGLKGLKHRDEPTMQLREEERMTGEGGPEPREPDTESQRELDFYKARIEKERQNAIALAQQEADQLAIQNANKQRQLKMAVGAKGTAEAITGRGIAARPEERPEISHGATQPDYQARQRQAALENKIRPQTEAERIQEEYDRGLRESSEPELSRDLGTELRAMSPEKQREFEGYLRDQARRRGFTVRDVPEVKNEKGEPIAGRIDLPTRSIELSQRKAGFDTTPHEGAGHGFLNDLLRSRSKTDQSLGLKALNAYRGERGGKPFKSLAEWEAYLRSNPEEAFKAQDSIEEMLARDIGVEGARQSKVSLYGNRRQRLRQWLEGAKSRWKNEFGLESPEDIRRHLTQRYRGDAPYGTRPELSPLVGKVVIPNGEKETQQETEGRALLTRESGEGEISPQKPEVVRRTTSKHNNPLGDPMGTTYRATPEDYAAYQAAQKDLKDLIASDPTMESPDFTERYQAIVKRNETIKNKYGGMPPEPPAAGVRESSTPEIMKGMEEQLQTAAMRKWKSVEGKEKVPKRAANELIHDIGNDVYNLVADKHPTFSPQDSWSVAEHLLGRHGPEGVKKAEDWLLGNIGQERLDELNDKAHRQKLIAEQRVNENERNLRETKKEAEFKTQELEAFTRPDVERQSEEPELPRASTQEQAEYPSSYGFSRLTIARNDRIADKIGTPLAKEVSYKLNQATTERDILEGRVVNRLIAQYKGYSPEEINRVRQYRHEIDNDFPAPFNLTAHEQTLKAALDKTYKDIGQMVIDSGLKVRSGETFRSMKLKPEGYQENMPAMKVIDAWSNAKPEGAEYDRLFIEHAMKRGQTEKQAEKLLEDYKQAVGNVGITPDTKFGAIRRVEGIGLPWELVEQNGMASARRYGRRVAADLAFYKYIQSDPRMLKALGFKDQFGKPYETSELSKGAKLDDVQYMGSSPEVIAAKRSLLGVDIPPNPVAQSMARIVGANIMQTGTAIRNLAALPTSIAPYYGVNLRTTMSALEKMNARAARAFENNAIKSSFKDFDAAGEFEGNPSKFIRFADKYVSFMRKWTGRDLSDRLEGLFTYSLGEELATKWFASAKAGDIEARRMLNRFGTTVEGGVKEKFLNRDAPISEDDIARVAKEFVDVARGSYSEKGLPSSAIEGPMAPFLALSRWSIERSNNFWKDAILPIKEHGNWTPFLKTVFASMLSGAAIEQLNEALSGKKGQDPTTKEVLLQGRKEDIMAKAIGLAQLGAFGGIVGDTMKFGANLAQGKNTRFSSPLSFPVATLAEDLAQKTSFAAEAIQEGEDPFLVLGEYMKELVRAQSQNSRYALNRLEEDATDRKGKFRDIRVFNELMGEGRSGETGEANPFLQMGEKEFKREGDLGKAVDSLPSLIDRIVEESGGDYEKLKKGLERLKANNYQTFPSMERTPQTASEFYDFLLKTQGKESADARLDDFMEMRAKNRVKGQLVPTLR